MGSVRGSPPHRRASRGDLENPGTVGGGGRRRRQGDLGKPCRWIQRGRRATAQSGGVGRGPNHYRRQLVCSYWGSVDTWTNRTASAPPGGDGRLDRAGGRALERSQRQGPWRRNRRTATAWHLRPAHRIGPPA